MSNPTGPAQAINIVLALMTAVSALTLATHYPLGGGIAVGVLLGLGAIFFWQPWLWLVLVPALLPLIGWAPWTGWLTFEEFDMLLLTAATVGYARLACKASMPTAQADKAPNATKLRYFGWPLMVLFGVSTLWSMERGFDDAGGFFFGWFQGYHEPMNSVRLAKSLFFALLLWPIWRAQSRTSVETPWGNVTAGLLWSAGMTVGLAGASMTTIWERVAFTGLLNFASDYRTTGMFWEMHVGGAALDGYLALTAPFAVHQLLLARKPWHWVSAGVAVGLGMYACLTTFSRGVYLALPVGMAVMLWLYYRQHQRATLTTPRTDRARGELAKSIWAGGMLVAIYALAATWIFPTSGYRGAFALMATMVALMALANGIRHLHPAAWVLAALLACLLAIALLGAYTMEGKSSYVGLALSFMGCLGAIGWAYLRANSGRKKHKASSRAAVLGLACYGGAVLSTGLIFLHWGDTRALSTGAPVLLLLLVALILVARAKRPLWPNTLRWQAVVTGCMLMSLMIVGVFTGGQYIGERFSTGREDLGGRLQHWQQGMDMLDNGAELWFGKGMGRYPGAFYVNGPRGERVGDYRLTQERDNQYLTLAGAQHWWSEAQLLRVSQRVGLPQGKVMLSMDVRTASGVDLRFEVCPKHLLFTDSACLTHRARVKGEPGVWQHLESPMQGHQVTRGDWYAPKLLVFSVAVANNDGVAAIDNLGMRDANGVELLANGDFSHGLSHWFMSSDRNHLPWHIKNMPLNVVFDQGIFGLLLWLGMVAVALWQLSLGAAQDCDLAPTIAGAVVGFGMVGLFDSLLDVPRVAFLFYFLVLLGMNLRGNGVSDSRNQRD